MHFVGILQAWKTSFLSQTNLPPGGTQKIIIVRRRKKGEHILDTERVAEAYITPASAELENLM